jgi:hypothetical protein
MSCHLYRHFDVRGSLLYVGISISAVARLCQHRGSPWFREIVRVDIERCQTRELAEFLEASAIKNEKPRYNRMQPQYKFSPTLSYVMIQEARAEAWEQAWAGEDVSSALQLCDEEEADIFPDWYRRRQKESKK